MGNASHSTVIYIVLFGFFSSYPLIFVNHDLSDSQIGLTLLPIILGFASLIPINYVLYKRFARKSALVSRQAPGSTGAVKIEPEERLLIGQYSTLLPRERHAC